MHTLCNQLRLLYREHGYSLIWVRIFAMGFQKTASYDKTDTFGPREKEKCQLTTSKFSAEWELVLPSLALFKINDGMNIMYDFHVY